MTVIIAQGDAVHLPLADASVDLVVTSPPYFGLRSYTDGGQHMGEQVGGEPTPDEYLDALVICTAEWMRVIKPGGSIFVNLGDKYATRYSSVRGGGRAGLNDDDDTRGRSGRNRSGVGDKSLIGLPWRYAIRCIDELSLILRAEIVWAKPNGLPESVTDRVRRSHEQVFHFVKQPRYYSAVDEVREEYAPSSLASYKRNGLRSSIGDGTHPSNPLGKLPGSVWTIPTSPLKVPDHLGIGHFAAYPPELVRRIVLGWSPREVCTACGEGRRPVSDSERTNGSRGLVTGAAFGDGKHGTADGKRHEFATVRTLTGYACGCPDTTAPATPGVVLDPMGGTGTTAMVADVLGRIGISVDLSHDYCRLAQWRTADENQRAKVTAKTGAKPKPKPKPKPKAAVAPIYVFPAELHLFGDEGENIA